MNCERVINDEIAERYLRGELSAADQEAFERHYFECARCFDELETYRAVTQELNEVARAPRTEPAPRVVWFDWRWAAAAGVVLAIAVSSWFFRSAPVPPGVTGTSPVGIPEAPPAVQQPAPAANLPTLTELAQVVAPRYTPTVLRGVPDEATSLFRDAMQRYVEGDYAAAKTGLQAAATLKADAPDIAFFLGICLLLTDNTAAAIEQFHRTVSLGESPYLEETRFYLAKAYLRRGELEAAESELRRMVQLRGDREKEGRELLQKVEVLRLHSSTTKR